MYMSPEIKNLLHHHYLTMRKMLAAGFPRRGVQKSFEELVYSVMGKNSWRPTHITWSALESIVKCHQGYRKANNIQRAHGILPGRMDRIDRTITMLSKDVMAFDEWWHFFTHHDKTILVTRTEHSMGDLFEESDLIELPKWDDDMFYNSGFSVKIRKKTEGVWLKKIYNKIQCVNEAKVS